MSNLIHLFNTWLKFEALTVWNLTIRAGDASSGVTESALLKVHNDIIIRMHKGEVTALTLLDLSAAFDTIDHATLTVFLIGMEYLARPKFSFLLIWKIGTHP